MTYFRGDIHTQVAMDQQTLVIAWKDKHNHHCAETFLCMVCMLKKKQPYYANIRAMYYNQRQLDLELDTDKARYVCVATGSYRKVKLKPKPNQEGRLFNVPKQ